MSESSDLGKFFAQVGAFIVTNKTWFIAGGAVLGVLILSLVIAAAVGAFNPAAGVASTFQLTSINFEDGRADSNSANAIGSYTRILDYAGSTAAGEVLAAAWNNDNWYVTHSRVTATGKYITRILRLLGGVYSITHKTSATESAANAPLDNTGTWTTNQKTPLQVFVTFTPSPTTLMRMVHVAKTNLALAFAKRPNQRPRVTTLTN